MVPIAQSLDILETNGTSAKGPDMAKFVAVFNGVGEVGLPGVSHPGKGGNQTGILEGVKCYSLGPAVVRWKGSKTSKEVVTAEYVNFTSQAIKKPGTSRPSAGNALQISIWTFLNR
jgi:hypothetical protein